MPLCDQLLLKMRSYTPSSILDFRYVHTTMKVLKQKAKEGPAASLQFADLLSSFLLPGCRDASWKLHWGSVEGFIYNSQGATIYMNVVNMRLSMLYHYELSCACPCAAGTFHALPELQPQRKSGRVQTSTIISCACMGFETHCQS